MQENIYRAISDWKKELFDFSKRNRLINCKIGGRSLELQYPEFDSVVQHFLIDGKTMAFPWKSMLIDDSSEDNEIDADESSETDNNPLPQNTKQRLPLSDYISLIGHGGILTNLTDRELQSKLKRLSHNAKIAQSEHGINILFVAMGFLQWYETDTSDDPIISPLILVPAVLRKTSLKAPWALERYDDEVVHNLCLWENLKFDFNLNLPEIPEQGFQDYSEIESYLDNIQNTIFTEGFTRRWKIDRRCILDCFSFQKMAMVKDLDDNKETIASHPICRIIAGDNTAFDDIAQGYSIINIGAKQLDEQIHPKKVFSVLDADSSQQEAIQAVISGKSIILDGPPGTGKSQTIANIIAEMLAKQKTILFVSEKSAALEVVKKRLDEVRLGDFCLDCHAMFSGKKGVVKELGRCLDIPCENYTSYQDELEELYATRQRLNSYALSLHQQFGNLKISPFEAHGLYLKYKQKQSFRSKHDNPLDMERSKLLEIRNLFRKLSNSPVIGNAKNHPWQGCLLSDISLGSQQIKKDFKDIANEIRLLPCPG